MTVGPVTALGVMLALVAGFPDSSTPLDALRRKLLEQQELRRFSLEIQVQTFARAGDRQPIHELTASVQRDGDRMLRTFQQFLILTSKRCTLTVDRNRSLILYSERQSAKQTVQLPLGADTLAAFESLLPPAANPSVRQVDGETWLLEEPVRFPGTQIRIAFDSADGRLKEITYLPTASAASSSGPIVIHYRWKDAADLDRSLMSEDHFVTRAHGQIVPAAAFKGYQVRLVDSRQNRATR